MRIIVRVKFLILVVWFTIANVSVANAEKTIDLEILKDACESIGFTPKTESFGECVLKLSERKDLRLVKIESTKKSDALPSNCSELYGCPPEKYDQEIEAEERYEQELEYYRRYNMAYTKGLNKNKDSLKYHNEFGKKIRSKEIDLYSKQYDDTKNNYSFCNSGNASRYLECFKAEKRFKISKNFQSEILNNNSNVLTDILTLGLIVGGIYLLGNSMSSLNTAVAPTTIINKNIISSNPTHLGPYKTFFGY